MGLLCCPVALAHVDVTQLQDYKVGKRYYATSNYAAAKAVFDDLLHARNTGTLTPYILFYYAISAYHNQEIALAETTFKRLLAMYPHWVQEDEIWYWLSQIRFEQKDYGAGLAYCAKITDIALAKHVKHAKYYFLRQLDDLTFLQQLFHTYPKDSTIAGVFAEKLAHQPRIHPDLTNLCALPCDANVRWEVYNPLNKLVSLKKKQYNVGVFLPFCIDVIDYEEEGSHSFVIALYQGIKMAVEELAEQGILINLVAYDTQKSPVVTAELLKQKEVKGLDLIIGPLYAATIPLVTDFARNHQINVFNPLSENAEVVGDNPFVFLFRPSWITQAKQAAAYTLQHCNTPCNVGIIHGTSPADVVQANVYKNCIAQSKQHRIAFLRAIAPEEAQNTTEDFFKTFVENEATQSTNESDLLAPLTHLYVASRDELIVANLLRVLAKLKSPPYIIGHATWLDHSAFTFNHLRQPRLLLIDPNHINYKKTAIYQFRKEFYARFSQYPTMYACIGYELMLFLGQMLSQHGVYFQKYWNKSHYPSKIFEGLVYGPHHDNQYVPILQWQKDRLVVRNQTLLTH